MMGKGEYVLGLEPSNVPGENRKNLRNGNILPYLQPGESTTNNIEIVLLMPTISPIVFKQKLIF
jgi:hypothetical protein